MYFTPSRLRAKNLKTCSLGVWAFSLSREQICSPVFRWFATPESHFSIFYRRSAITYFWTFIKCPILKSLLEICEKWWSETMETINFHFLQKKWKKREHNFFHFSQETRKTPICKFLRGDMSPYHKNARRFCENCRDHICFGSDTSVAKFLARLHVLGDACFSCFKNVQKRDLPKKCANFIMQHLIKMSKKSVSSFSEHMKSVWAYMVSCFLNH